MLKTDAKENDSATNLKHPLQMQASDSLSFSTAAGPQEKGFGKIFKPIGRIVKPIARIIKPIAPILGPVSNALQIAQQIRDLKRKD